MILNESTVRNQLELLKLHYFVFRYLRAFDTPTFMHHLESFAPYWSSIEEEEVFGLDRK
jgi:hypothetical protein